MSRALKIVSCLFLATLLFGSAGSSDWQIKPCKVVRAVDDDTIIVTGWEPGETTVRLLHVDAPEGDKSYTGERLEGMTVLVQSRGRHDRYARLLAYVFSNFSLELVQQTKANYDKGFGTSELYHKEFEAAEKKARGDLVQDLPPPPSIQQKKAKEASAMVYITKTGSKYHRGSCSYLRKSKISISLKDAKRRGYTPCSRCRPP